MFRYLFAVCAVRSQFALYVAYVRSCDYSLIPVTLYESALYRKAFSFLGSLLAALIPFSFSGVDSPDVVKNTLKDSAELQ